MTTEKRIPNAAIFEICIRLFGVLKELKDHGVIPWSAEAGWDALHVCT